MQKVMRNKYPEQKPEIRKNNFEEVAQNFDLETAKAEAERCLNCKNAPCKKGCPVGVPIPEFLQKLKTGDAAGAAEVIKTTNNLPSVCGRVCPQEEQCEKVCIRAKMEGAVAIGALERFCGDFALNNSAAAEVQKGNAKGKVAIVGSGPSGLSCAADCAKAGLSVTIFEAFHVAGGVLVYGIPEFRLPKALVQKEIDNLLKLGVELKLNVVVGKTITIEQILEDYDAVFIGNGAGLPVFLGVKGENLGGVYSANEYLTRVNLMKAYREDSDTPILKGKNVVVFGAGNVAMDAARTALRLKSESVTIVYRRSENEMPARKEELHHAKEEGVVFKTLTAPLELIGENGKVKSVRCQEMQLGEVDAKGRRSVTPIENSEFFIDCDLAIVAIGTSPNPIITESAPDLSTTNRGTIIVSEAMATSIEGVYAGGDAVTGAATVILAMEAGKKAAKSIVLQLSE